MKKIYILLIIILLLGGYILFNLSFLWEEIALKKISLDQEKVLVISDIHLESNPRDLKFIGDYIKENNISCLIINGDLFDKKHKEEFKRELLDSAKERLGIEGIENIIYILALHSHDPYLRESGQEFEENGTKVIVWRGAIELEIKGKKFYLLHGDYIIRHGSNALLVNKLTSDLFWEKLAKKIIGGKKEEWVFLGHSHMSGIDYENKIANTGCWIKRIVSPTDTAILIEVKDKLEPEVNLIKIPQLSSISNTIKIYSTPKFWCGVLG